jgi:peptidylprolyl isomerase
MEYTETTEIPEDQRAEALGEASARQGTSKPLQDANVANTAAKSGEDQANGLKYETLKEGTGKVAQMGQNVTVHYVGTLPDGKEFDSSRRSGKPFTFKLGSGDVIKGWDLGVAGMKVGEQRRLMIPADLAYGPEGRPPVIPPNSPLNFDIELLSVK